MKSSWYEYLEKRRGYILAILTLVSLRYSWAFVLVYLGGYVARGCCCCSVTLLGGVNK